LRGEEIAIVSDFDGTIAVRDIGHHFFRRFIPDSGAHNELLEKWKVGLISSKECLEREISWIRARREDLDRFIEEERLDPYFKDFIDYVNRRRFGFLILSDGLDYYIDAMLMKNGFGYLEFKSNHLVFDGDLMSGVEFPWYDPEVCKMCGNCKRHHVNGLKDRGLFTVYVGNGYSDRCPAETADLVFAKGELMDHCLREGLDCVEYHNFRDVEMELTSRLLLSD
jgi:2,3-diketo-5-methylthio-1-phosphopentane phosphatase